MIGREHGKIELAPVIATFMPVVQPTPQTQADRFSQTETVRFLKQCQQQATDAHQAKIASISYRIAPLTPWNALQTLAQTRKRHFYYDPPQQPSVVGVGVLVGSSATGSTRFDQAQHFIQRWRSHFLYASQNQAERSGRFFCSATFFDEATATHTTTASQLEAFEPVYIFVPQIQVSTQLGFSTVTFNSLVDQTTEIEQLAAQLHNQLEQLIKAKPGGSAQSASSKIITKNVLGFATAVETVLHTVKAGKLHKVVLADVMDVVAPQAIDEVKSLQTLRQNHPDCTVFAVSNGKGQSFIGASPERLLSIDQGQLITDALAGSAPRSALGGIDHQLAQSLLHSEKERYEHSVVVDFIVRQLRSLNLTPHCTSAPQILQLAHIQHLHTPISASLKQQNVSPLKILNKLHPTPAVAGLPRQPACDLIRQHETFDRGLYAAPLGWIDTEGNSEFIVGIRSALINGCKARLYAGAGIVTGSQPAKELAEIKLKLQTLLNALV